MAIKKESKRQYLARRRQRVRDLYLHRGLQPVEIASALVTDGTIETTDESLASAIRLVEADVKAIRAEINDERTREANPNVAQNEIDALERELSDLRKERDRQFTIAAGEPDANGKEAVIVGTMMGAGGEPVNFSRPKWRDNVRQTASKDGARLAEKVGKLERLLIEKRAVLAEQPRKDAKSDAIGDGVFRVVTSGKTTEELIDFNVNGGEGPAN